MSRLKQKCALTAYQTQMLIPNEQVIQAIFAHLVTIPSLTFNSTKEGAKSTKPIRMRYLGHLTKMDQSDRNGMQNSCNLIGPFWACDPNNAF